MMDRYILTMAVTADVAARLLSQCDNKSMNFVSMSPETTMTPVPAKKQPVTMNEVIESFCADHRGPFQAKELAPYLTRAGYTSSPGTALFNYTKRFPKAFKRVGDGLYQHVG